MDTLTRPNGIAVTRDGRTLYVADNASPGGVVTLVAFDLDARGDAVRGRVLYDFGGGRGIDGMALDSERPDLGHRGYEGEGGDLRASRRMRARRRRASLSLHPDAGGSHELHLRRRAPRRPLRDDHGVALSHPDGVRGQASPPGK